MDDYISRQAAIDMLEGRIQANAALVSELNRCIGYLMQLPSVQTEREDVKYGEICKTPELGHCYEGVKK